MVGYVGVVHVYPVAHLLGEVAPAVGVLHHLLAAGLVVLLYRDFLPDILLGYTQHGLHAQLYREPVGIPAGFTLYQVSALGLVAADGILYAARHYVVDAREPIG